MTKREADENSLRDADTLLSFSGRLAKLRAEIEAARPKHAVTAKALRYASDALLDAAADLNGTAAALVVGAADDAEEARADQRVNERKDG